MRVGFGERGVQYHPSPWDSIPSAALPLPPATSSPVQPNHHQNLAVRRAPIGPLALLARAALESQLERLRKACPSSFALRPVQPLSSLNLTPLSKRYQAFSRARRFS